MKTLNKLLSILALSIIALLFTISVYGGLSNPFSSKLDEKTVKSLDNVVELVKSKGSQLSPERYDSLVSTIDNRLEYLSYEMKGIRSSLNLGSNAQGSGVNCAVEQPALYPNQTGPVAQNSKKLLSSYSPPIKKDGIWYYDGYDDSLYSRDDSFINNKTIFGGISKFSDVIGFPLLSMISNGASGGNHFFRINLKNYAYLALKFNSGPGISSGEVSSDAANAWLGGPANGISISISECPGNFTHLKSKKCLQNGSATAPVRWSTDPNANDRYANALNPDSRDGFYCIIEKNKDYYMNFTFADKSSDFKMSICGLKGNEAPGTISEKLSCGILGTLKLFPYGDYIFENSK